MLILVKKLRHNRDSFGVSERVYYLYAWLDSKMLARFMQPMAGMTEAEVITDASVNGKFEIIMMAGEERMLHSGTYLKISRPDKLVFTWKTSHSVDGSTVTLEFKEIDKSNTQIELTHVKFIDEETRDNHIGG